jgi:hypothetical protein
MAKQCKAAFFCKLTRGRLFLGGFSSPALFLLTQSDFLLVNDKTLLARLL